MILDVDALACAVATGRQLAAGSGELSSGSIFTDQLWAQVTSRLGRAQRVTVRRAMREAGAGLLSARQGRLLSSLASLERAVKLIAAPDLTEEARRVGRSMIDASYAYLDHRRGDDDSARHRIARAISDDEWLETECGYRILHLHRIQLLHNRVRLAALTGDQDGAMELALRLLRHLDREAGALSDVGRFDVAVLASLPTELVEALSIQIATEIALILASDGRLVLRPGPDLATDGPVKQWLTAKRAIGRGDSECFARVAVELLAAGPKGAPLLRADLLMDVVERVPATSALRSVHEELDAALLPPTLERRLARLTAVATRSCGP